MAKEISGEGQVIIGGDEDGNVLARKRTHLSVTANREKEALYYGNAASAQEVMPESISRRLKNKGNKRAGRCSIRGA